MGFPAQYLCFIRSLHILGVPFHLTADHPANNIFILCIDSPIDTTLEASYSASKMPNVFYVPIFFIVFRETIETSIVVSILLTFLKQQLGSDPDVSTYKRLRKQVNFVSFSFRLLRVAN